MRTIAVLSLLTLVIMACSGCSVLTRTALFVGREKKASPSPDTHELQLHFEWPAWRVGGFGRTSQMTGYVDPPARRAPVSARFAEIEQRTKEVRAAWEREQGDNRSTPLPLEAQESDSAGESLPSSQIVQPDLVALEAIERKYAPQFLNGRLRVMALEIQLSGADTWQKSMLEKKIEDAKANLAAINDQYRREIDAALGRQ